MEEQTWTQSHPCLSGGCPNTVAYDDEPYCFTHSPDSGSYAKGYSYRAAQQRKAERQAAEAESVRQSGKPF